MKRLWSSVAGLPVISSEDEQPVGKLRAAFVHPETGQIIAFLVTWTRVITPRDIRQWGKHAVTIARAEDLSAPEDILRLQEFGLRRTFLSGKKVLTRSGKSLGKLHDFTFDTSTDHLTTLETARAFLFWEWAPRLFPAADIQEITDRNIILNIEDEQKLPQKKVTEEATFPVAAAANATAR